MAFETGGSNGDSQHLRRVFAFHDRFAPTFTRFLHKSLNVDPTVSLVSVENGTDVFSPRSDSVLFCAGTEGLPAAAVMIPRAFLLGVIDRSLGHGVFMPGRETDSWSELDENLAVPFVAHLFEILLGYCDPSALPGTDAVFVSEESVLPSGVWFTVEWNVSCGEESFSFLFFLPESAAFGAEPDREFENYKPQADDELLRYIEMRRAASEKIRDPEELAPPADQTASIRVLVGSFDLNREDLDEMKPGDILTTDISAEAPFTLFINGESAAFVRPGEHDGKKGVIVE